MALIVSLVIAACLAPLWYAGGQAAQTARIPAISGVLLVGFLCGPFSLALLRERQLSDLKIVEHICLSYIALLAGAELRTMEILKARRQVTALVTAISLASWAMVGGSTLLATFMYEPFLTGASTLEAMALCNILGVLAMARSPAAAIAVLKETRGTGPYCGLIMAVVVLKDVALFVAFTAAVGFLQLATSEKLEAKTGFSSWVAAISTSLLYTLVNLLASAATGLALGGSFVWARHWFASKQPWLFKAAHAFTRSTFVPAQRICGGVLPIIGSSIIYFSAHKFHGDGLLACVTAGLVMSHLQNGSSEGAHHESSNNNSNPDTRSTTTSLSTAHEVNNAMAVALPLVSTVFFGLVGANLHLHKVIHNTVPVFFVFFVRLGAIWLGSALGGRAGGVPDPIRRRVWMGMVTQGGIAMGLSRVVVSRFRQASWVPEFEAVMAGVILCNLAVGPPLFRAAILATGESGGRGLESSSKLISISEDSSTSSGTIRPMGSIPVINLVRSMEHFASRVGGASDIAL